MQQGDANNADLLDSSDSVVLANLNSAVDTLNQMKAFPIDKATVIQILLASALPLLIAATKLMSLSDILKKLLSALV